MKLSDKDLVPAVPPALPAVDNTLDDLVNQIISEQDVQTSQDLMELFNWNLTKKNAIRLLKLNGLHDTIVEQMIDRFKRRSGEFSNNDLLNYLSTIENSIQKTSDRINTTESAPQIKVNNTTNTQVNVNVLDSFDSTSKERIADAIKDVLRGLNESTTNQDNFDTITYSIDEEDKTDEHN